MSSLGIYLDIISVLTESTLVYIFETLSHYARVKELAELMTTDCQQQHLSLSSESLCGTARLYT